MTSHGSAATIMILYPVQTVGSENDDLFEKLENNCSSRNRSLSFTDVFILSFSVVLFKID